MSFSVAGGKECDFRMLAYIARRIISMIPSLILTSILVFSFIHLIPGDPILIMLGDQATPQQAEILRENMGLNKPLYVQYTLWITRMFYGDMGQSIFFHQPVWTVIKDRAETSIFIALMSITMIIFVGVPIGIFSAAQCNTGVDQCISGVSMFFASVPTFWLGLNLMFIFAVRLKWLPTSGFPSVLESGDWSNLRYLILPCITLAAPNSALIVRMTRSSMLDVSRADYVKTAYAKGLGEMAVTLKHIFRNSLVTVVSVLGFTFVGLMASTAVTETVFSLPGIGRLIVESVLRRDYPIIQGIILIVAMLYMTVNLIVDLIFVFLDPRIRA
jgi:peptide/nickel transport system permease protein